MTGPPASGRGLSVLDRIRSAYHGFWLAVSERVRFQRGPPPLRASGRLPPLAPAQAARVRELAARYGRRDHARANIAGVAGARFEVADYARFAEPAEVVTAFFPFVTPRPVLAWRLPLSVLAPEALFARIAGNLRPGGQLVLFSHGLDEARLAIDIAMGAGLRQLGAATGLDPLVSRPQPPVATLWTVAGPSRP